MTSDVPTGLVFEDPEDSARVFSVVLWAPPGSGKSVMAASAPGPILAITADRKGAYRFARKYHAPKVIREVRYAGLNTLSEAWTYLQGPGNDVRTVILDPVTNLIDHLRDAAPQRADGDIDHQWVNKKFVDFLHALQSLDINVVLVAHEKLNDGKKGDGKLYPAIGGGGLINKVCGKMDVVAHVERHQPEEGEPAWGVQLQPRGNLVVKDGTGVLGERRLGDLSEWFEFVAGELAVDNSDLPFDEAFEAEVEEAQAA